MSGDLTGWGARVRHLIRDHLKLKVADFEGVLGISKGSVYDYEMERTAPNLTFLLKLSEMTGRSVHWIATGQELPSPTLDESKLRTAIKGTLSLVEAARRQGRDYPLDDIVAMVTGLYEDMTKIPLDGSNSYDDSATPGMAEEEAPLGTYRKTRS